MTWRLNSALWHARTGFSIFPVAEYEKTPHVTTPPYTLKWSAVATDDEPLIRQWWTVWPNANIGVACKPSRLLVVDCDAQKRPNQLEGTPYGYLHSALGARIDGLGQLVFSEVCEQLEGNWAEAQDTYTVATGSGGLHYYYWWPEGVQASQASIVPGVLDIRCNGGDKGGYVLGAGSETHAGKYTATSFALVRQCPAWLVARCTDRPTLRPEAPEYERPGHVSYQGLANLVAYAPEGTRNGKLLWAARAMCEDGASEEEAHTYLGEAATANGLTAVETRDTIRSAYRLQGGKL